MTDSFNNVFDKLRVYLDSVPDEEKCDTDDKSLDDELEEAEKLPKWSQRAPVRTRVKRRV
jgi:hypothetical protein